jgi:hypothetical protein
MKIKGSVPDLGIEPERAPSRYGRIGKPGSFSMFLFLLAEFGGKGER